MRVNPTPLVPIDSIREETLGLGINNTKTLLTKKSNQILEQDLISNSQQIGIHLSTDFFIPFEIISIILLVSLIGAIVIARQ